jgi:voltage-gated potassium channel
MSDERSPTLDYKRIEMLQQWEAWLEMPMLVLGFAWLGLFIIELIWGLNPLLVAIAAIIWIIFIVDFGIKFLLAPHKIYYESNLIML